MTSILVIEDEKDILDLLDSHLEQAGFEVLTAADGGAGLNLAREKRPDLIVLDVRLPDIEGGDVASKLSEDPITRNIPVIFLTALIRKQEEEKMMKTGNRYILAKPAMKEEILALINKILV